MFPRITETDNTKKENASLRKGNKHTLRSKSGEIIKDLLESGLTKKQVTTNEKTNTKPPIRIVSVVVKDNFTVL